MIINISEAKTQLSKLVDLVPHKPEGKRKLGLLHNQVKIPENFLDEDEDINEMFYGKTR
jgi:hypothetical protein